MDADKHRAAGQHQMTKAQPRWPQQPGHTQGRGGRRVRLPAPARRRRLPPAAPAPRPAQLVHLSRLHQHRSSSYRGRYQPVGQPHGWRRRRGRVQPDAATAATAAAADDAATAAAAVVAAATAAQHGRASHGQRGGQLRCPITLPHQRTTTLRTEQLSADMVSRGGYVVVWLWWNVWQLKVSLFFCLFFSLQKFLNVTTVTFLGGRRK